MTDSSQAQRRIDTLLDEGSFVEIGAAVTSRLAERSAAYDKPGDGVVTGYGTIGGCLVYIYAQDASVFGGSIGEMHSGKIMRIYDMAVKMGAPIISLIDCAGVRLSEGTDSLYGFGQMFLNQTKASGVIPQIAAVFGTCGGGMAVSASMSDFVFMEKEKGKLFINSPDAVTGNYTEKCDTASAEWQARETGIADFTGSEEEILQGIRELVGVLPANNQSDLSYDSCEDDLNRQVEGIDSLSSKADMLKMISDNGLFIEVKKEHAPSVTTGFIRRNGQTVGAVANSESDITHFGCKKAIHFLNFCDAFEIPVLTLCDVSGFAKDKCNEKNLARALGKLTFTYAKATVPMVTLITGHAYGTAGVVMGSKSIGADIVYAWENADMGLMDPKEAAKLVYEKEIAEASDSVEKLKELTEQYRRNVSSAHANAMRGYIDDIIVPSETRQRLIAAFEMLFTKSVYPVSRKHGTV